MQEVPSFILHTLSGRLLHHNSKIKWNSKTILELQLWILWFVKKMCWIITSSRWFCSVYVLEQGSRQIVDSITTVNYITIYATHRKQRFLFCWCSLKGLLNQTHLIWYRLSKEEKLGKRNNQTQKWHKLPLTQPMLQLTCSSFSDLVQAYFMKCNGRNY